MSPYRYCVGGSAYFVFFLICFSVFLCAPPASHSLNTLLSYLVAVFFRSLRMSAGGRSSAWSRSCCQSSPSSLTRTTRRLRTSMRRCGTPSSHRAGLRMGVPMFLSVEVYFFESDRSLLHFIFVACRSNGVRIHVGSADGSVRQ